MKKLLLLTLLPLTAFLSSFAGKFQQGENISLVAFNDSTIKQAALVNPREGFKDLFESSVSTTGFNVKLNPLAFSFVEGYMEVHSKKLNKMKDWGKPYFDMMDNVLTKYGLPEELKYLSVIESDLKSYAVSWAGAVGPWQFMPATARLMGLRVTKKTDERTDFNKSTHAAARYLTQLYGLYNDWLLVIAAYNGGPGNVNSAIRRSGSRNFWKLQYHLPAESRKHVKKFIATHYIMEGTGGLTTLTKSERLNQINDLSSEVGVSIPNAETINLSGKYNSLVIAQNIQMDINEFNQMNPGFDKQLASTGSYDLQLPSDKALVFQSVKPQILEQSIKLALASATKSF
jgi:membrane-bound lytic murein transglycosylase D